MARTSTQSSSVDFVLINEFDSVEQSKLIAEMTLSGLDTSAIESHFVGLLRMGLILCQEVVVTDAMLLDGKFFHMVGPQDLEHRLGLAGQTLGIRVLSSHSTLRQALEAKLADTSFVWQLNSLDSPGFPSRDTQSRWLEWVEAEERGALSMKSFAERPAGSFSDTLKNLLAEPDRLRDLTTTFADDVITTAQSLHTTRSDAFNYFDSLPHAQEEIGGLRDWWNQSYLESIAREQGAAWMSFRSESKSSDNKTFRIWDSLFGKVCEASPAVYSTMFYALDNERQKWHSALTSQSSLGRHRRGNRALAGIAYIVANHLVSSGRLAVGARALMALGLAAIGILLTQVGAENKPELSWIIFAVALAGFPWHEIRTFIKAVRLGRRGVLKIV